MIIQLHKILRGRTQTDSTTESMIFILEYSGTSELDHNLSNLVDFLNKIGPALPNF